MKAVKKATYEEIAEVVSGVLAEAAAEVGEAEFVVGISRGGLFPAMVVSTALVKPLVVAYIDKKDNVHFDRGEWIRGKRVLLVDDIIRTGKTINKIRELLLENGATSVATLTPYYLETARHHAPNYGKMTPEDIAFPWDE